MWLAQIERRCRYKTNTEFQRLRTHWNDSILTILGFSLFSSFFFFSVATRKFRLCVWHITYFYGTGCSRGQDLRLLTTVFPAPSSAILHQISNPSIFSGKREWVNELMNEHMAAQAFTVLFHRQRRNFRKIVAMLVWVPPEAVTETRSQVQVIYLGSTYLLSHPILEAPKTKAREWRSETVKEGG